MADERDPQVTPPPASAPEKVKAALEFCEGLFARMGAEVDIEVKETADAIGLSLKPRDGNRVELSSAFVEALQYLANRVANPRAEGRKWVNIEVGGFADESDPVVKAMAERLAATAKKMGKVIALAPISARERRQIHLALMGVEGVSTRSEGEGLFRTLMIVPDGGKGSSGPAEG